MSSSGAVSDSQYSSVSAVSGGTGADSGYALVARLDEVKAIGKCRV